jgi:chromosome segregation ATPase
MMSTQVKNQFNSPADGFREDHERLFDEICNKLKELSVRPAPAVESSMEQSEKFEKMQTQIKRFQQDLVSVEGSLMDKIKSIESLQHHQVDANQQLRLLSDQLHTERQINVKLNSDLSKSLEINLQLQLELQSSRNRFQQFQMDEKKYSSALQEKSQALQKELELMTVLKDETQLEYSKAKNEFASVRSDLESENQELLERNEELLKENQELLANNSLLNADLEKMSSAMNELEEFRKKQNEALKNLMEAAEKKIMDYKMALDKKTIEAQDYYGHLQQTVTQVALLKKENSQLRDYVNRMNQQQASQQRT